jgi:hypothetical protein
VLGLAVGACQAPPVRSVQSPTATSVEELGAAIAADAKRSDHEADSKARSELTAEASRDADACLARDADSVVCLYGKALALGLEARSHPTRAAELLTAMLGYLTKAEAVDANYDEAGPARVRALVLIRAPGWPLGPGDADAGLEAARRAANLRSNYPPNLLALADALAKTGDANGAREAFRSARDAAQAVPPSSDRDDWLHEAAEGLNHP